MVCGAFRVDENVSIGVGVRAADGVVAHPEKGSTLTQAERFTHYDCQQFNIILLAWSSDFIDNAISR